ncbi:glycosyltransferase involved in cell wall biosynthesis [Desulfomicrobium macestii]|uniref:Glycosyltransferase involved in cell wall bisynthesis n=2 Tax=Desulfomicrobium TaxID=898 RepID=A0A8G2C5F2_DESNO|nr:MULTISPECIES: glycosyltransferase [Desulfomicrobium]MBE1424791.1 glycosyltransferase involved in cell wall biosynthesis [Desulfomicrobium macestii]SFM10880.1 Glycosyltransferase involved in cell wall bisynthesis [Desulfomicrobium norvegicum]
MAQHLGPVWGTLDPFVEGGPIIGRKVANAGFLRALLEADPFAAYHFFLADRQSGEALQTYVQSVCPQALGKIRILPRTALPEHLARTSYHAFHLSDCLTSQGFLAAIRNRLAHDIFPITGVTHSLSYARYGQSFAQHVWSGNTPRDCIVATSSAGADVVREELAALGEAYGAPVPQVAVVPLGVWCSEFDAPGPGGVPAVPESKTVFLVPGRISPYSKMDLLPLLRAFQRVRQGGTKLDDVCLVLAGSPDEGASLPHTLTNLAANIGLELVVVRCPDDATRTALLHRADVVVSLADNPQETFGLTILEAAAAAKPVIASDYDGYRDLVRHGLTGFLVSTLDSGEVDDISLLAPLLYDSTYHLWLAQDVAVDVGELAGHLHAMLRKGVREGMGRAAREHALGFDWSRIIGRYLELWERLAAASASRPDGDGHPLLMRHGRIFAGYPTRRLAEGDVLEITDLGRAVYRGKDFPVVYAGIEDRIDLELMRKVLVWTRRPLPWTALQEKADAAERLPSTVMWMLKGDLLRVSAVSESLKTQSE